MRFSIVDRGDDNSKRVAETLKKKCIDIGWEYDDENKTGVMRVQFKSGRTYDYFPVSKEKYDEFWKENSKGSWIQRELVKAPSVNYEEVTLDE